MRESTIESALRDAVKSNGGRMLKWTSPGQRGVPDNICLWPGGLDLIELKRTGEGPTPEQKRFYRDVLKPLGIKPIIINSLEDAIAYVHSRAPRTA